MAEITRVKDAPQHEAFKDFILFAEEMNLELTDKNQWWNSWLFWLDGYRKGYAAESDNTFRILSSRLAY